MEFETKTGCQGHVYIPKKMRNFLGNRLKIIPNNIAILIFPANALYPQVLKSLKVITADIENKIALSQETLTRD